jgi:hypothetical protein
VIPTDLLPAVNLLHEQQCFEYIDVLSACVGRGLHGGVLVAVQKMVQEFRERRDVFVDGLNDIPGIRCLRPHGAFYLFPNISAYGRSEQRDRGQALNEAGVAACREPHLDGMVKATFDFPLPIPSKLSKRHWTAFESLPVSCNAKFQKSFFWMELIPPVSKSLNEPAPSLLSFTTRLPRQASGNRFRCGWHHRAQRTSIDRD